MKLPSTPLNTGDCSLLSLDEAGLSHFPPGCQVPALGNLSRLSLAYSPDASASGSLRRPVTIEGNPWMAWEEMQVCGLSTPAPRHDLSEREHFLEC